MTFDAVIATYNRPDRVQILVNSLLECRPAFNKIIVCDSSDQINTAIKGCDGVVYIHSNHKNQPYQRYLGYLLAESDYLVYFDDDMEIVEPAFLSIFEKKFEDSSIVGIQPKMKNLHDDTTIQIRDSVFNRIWSKNNSLINILRWATMYPRLQNGKWWYCGLRGSKPDDEECNLEWVSGWAFAAKRSALYKNINFQLFDIFEDRIGMGEDLLIGHLLSKVGLVIYIPSLLFLHNDQRNSNYTPDHYSYGKRTMFSRYFLSLEYARINNHSFLKARFIFLYYSIFRVAGLLINLVIHHSDSDIRIFKGYISGISAIKGFRYKTALDSFWLAELNKNRENG
jgi:glycosyltransferase involved in cell wall biosynthesis